MARRGSVSEAHPARSRLDPANSQSAFHSTRHGGREITIVYDDGRVLATERRIVFCLRSWTRECDGPSVEDAQRRSTARQAVACCAVHDEDSGDVAGWEWDAERSCVFTSAQPFVLLVASLSTRTTRKSCDAKLNVNLKFRRISKLPCYHHQPYHRLCKWNDIPEIVVIRQIMKIK